MKCNLTQAENKFLTIFSEEWEKTIKKYNCPQEQMNDGSRLRPLMAFWGYLAAIPILFSGDSYKCQDLLILI